jgi:hypothetical protein
MTDLTSTQFAPQAGMLGRLPQRAPADRFPLNWAHDYLAAPVPPPAYPIDVTGGITDFGMLGNDQYGDCGEAGIRHVEMTTAAAAGGPIPSFTTQESVAEYLAFTGGQDTGVVLADFLLWLFNKGRIKGFAPVDHNNIPQADALMAEFHGLYVGVSLTSDAQQLFPGGIWTTDNGETPNPSMGHCIEKAYSDGGTYDGWITWARLMRSTINWSRACVDEIWLVLTTEEQLAKFTPALITEIQALGGKVAPTPPPPPPPPPPPAPKPPAPKPPQPVPGTPPSFIQRVEQIAREEIASLERTIDEIKQAVSTVGGEL